MNTMKKTRMSVGAATIIGLGLVGPAVAQETPSEEATVEEEATTEEDSTTDDGAVDPDDCPRSRDGAATEDASV